MAKLTYENKKEMVRVDDEKHDGYNHNKKNEKIHTCLRKKLF